ncbi:hypothetical protein VT84_06255 [Gemmata sp. SH-PL17]|uniref:DUF429 domain-containing protein n=1 Tax=Gemmata sp. SH-PL17 TaxID=1630693 RepID=UPI00078B2CB6|nr:DUF429 domain-containing protein [Gemmata sp. SH-PL17]AMV23978.1 hypothetical protein VT84_06255 [Gemmata sp. SH-PL17]
MKLPVLEHFFGVDFSGARQAGDFIWVAELEPHPRPPRLALTSLRPLSAICGTAERAPALAHLVGSILESERALWGFDFPFGLPVELFPKGTPWEEQFAFLSEWEDDAYGCGLECVRRATELLQRKHIRRASDTEARTPFDTFHYRLIYQTFFGMRDVVNPLRRAACTAVLPFQYRKLARAKRVVVECCPGSVLKLLGVPHQNYKQPKGGPLTRVRRATRHAILEWLEGAVRVGDRFRRVIMRNPGGTRSTRSSRPSARPTRCPRPITARSPSTPGTGTRGTCTCAKPHLERVVNTPVRPACRDQVPFASSGQAPGAQQRNPFVTRQPRGNLRTEFGSR